MRNNLVHMTLFPLLLMGVIGIPHDAEANISPSAEDKNADAESLLPYINAPLKGFLLGERSLSFLPHSLRKPVDEIGDALKYLLEKFMHTKRPNETCYPGVGCFYYNESMRLEIGGPESPEQVNTTFYFFKNDSSDLDALLNSTENTTIPNKTFTLDNWTSEYVNTSLNVDMPLMVVTHGLTGSKRTPWMLPLVRALLENVNCTVLVVDWERGANGSYPDAGINTPMAGALISLFLQKVINETNCTMAAENITLIGFSMGAQVMGFAGRHFRKATNVTLGRIAALDPAGWLYEGTNATLSKSDATYVDVIHTNAGSIKDFRIGLNESVGHVDFYPNGGTVQTGCRTRPNILFTNYMDVITCSHYKAPELFIESLNNRNCSFNSWKCESWDDFRSGNCTNRTSANDTGVMGFYSYTATGRGNQYLYTNAKSPYCRGNSTTAPENNTSALLSLLKEAIPFLKR